MLQPSAPMAKAEYRGATVVVVVVLDHDYMVVVSKL
jgi:hypothetical protein